MIIETRFIGPTNTRGARIKATIDRPAARGNGKFSVTVAYDYRAGSGAGGAHMQGAVDVIRAWNLAVQRNNVDTPGMAEALVITDTFTYVGETPDGKGYIYSAPSNWAPRFSVAPDGGTYSTENV